MTDTRLTFGVHRAPAIGPSLSYVGRAQCGCATEVADEGTSLVSIRAAEKAAVEMARRGLTVSREAYGIRQTSCPSCSGALQYRLFDVRRSSAR